MLFPFSTSLSHLMFAPRSVWGLDYERHLRSVFVRDTDKYDVAVYFFCGNLSVLGLAICACMLYRKTLFTVLLLSFAWRCWVRTGSNLLCLRVTRTTSPTRLEQLPYTRGSCLSLQCIQQGLQQDKLLPRRVRSLVWWHTMLVQPLPRRHRRAMWPGLSLPLQQQ